MRDVTELFDRATAMGRLMAAHDWQGSPLGAPGAWPLELRLAVRTLLASREPRSISWGPSLALLYNDAYAAMMDARHPGALGQPLPEVWGDVWPLIEPDVRAAQAGEGCFRSTVPMSRLEGGVRVQRWHSYGYSPLFDADGRVLGVQCLSLNVTDQVSFDALRERELRSLRQVFAAAPGFAAVVRGPSFVYEMTNPAYDALVGGRDLIGRPVREAFPELASQGYFEMLDRVFASGEPFTGLAMPVVLHDADGAATERFVDFVMQPLADDAGRVERIFMQGSEVTDRERALRALQAESANKDAFLALLAHELRNPLAPIATAASLLVAGCDAGHAKQLGEVVQRQARHLHRIVDDLFDVSRASRGTFQLERKPLDLAGVLAAAFEQVSPLAERKHQVVEWSLPDAPVWVVGDASRLTQVMANLLVNASRYTPERGRVQVSLACSEGRARLTVADNGRGIEPHMLPRIFELFTQAGSNEPSRDGGLGLGLPLVRRLVELHGGEVTAASAGPGQGASFTIHLPLVR
jgi:signal transduction histidine kinase